jgi:hypothetical protein
MLEDTYFELPTREYRERLYQIRELLRRFFEGVPNAESEIRNLLSTSPYVKDYYTSSDENQVKVGVEIVYKVRQNKKVRQAVEKFKIVFDYGYVDVEVEQGTLATKPLDILYEILKPLKSIK